MKELLYNQICKKNYLKDFEDNYEQIENDMNSRNSMAKKDTDNCNNCSIMSSTKTRKKREELSVNACRSIRKEFLSTELKLS